MDELAAWLRGAIEERKAKAIAADERHWETGDMTGDVSLAGPSGGYVAVGAYGNDLDPEVGEHIAANDPRDTIAQCEADLALLDLHCVRHGTGGSWDTDPPALCNEEGQLYPCETVAIIAWGYRHRDGYRAEEWGP